MSRLIDLTGTKFGRLTVIRQTENKGKRACWLCKCDCGNEREVTGSDMRSGNTKSCGCSKGFTHEEYIRKLLEKGIEVKPIEQYRSGHNKLLHLCTCGKEWNVRTDTVLRGGNCGCRQEEGLSLGRGINIKPHEEYIQDLKKNNIEVLPIETYIDCRTKILHKCVCGNDFKISPTKVFRGHFCGCKFKEYLKNSIQDDSVYRKKLEDKKINVVPLEEYKGSHKKIKHRCKCGNEWYVQPTNVLTGYSTCGCEASKGEEIIKRWLKELNIKFKPQLSFKDLRGKRRTYLKYDFGIYKNDKLLCLIEYQGRQHYKFTKTWHRTKEGFKESQDRDKKKRDYAKQKSIPLLEIHYKDKKPLRTLEQFLVKLDYFDLFTTIVG